MQLMGICVKINNLLLISSTLYPHSGLEKEAICRGWQLGLSLSLVLPVWVNRNVPSVIKPVLEHAQHSCSAVYTEAVT